MSGISKRAVITGISGGLGRALAERLGAGRTLAIDRDEAARSLAERFVAGDVTRVNWVDLLRPGDVIFHLAAFVHRRPRSPSEVTLAYAVNTEATTRLAEAARVAGATLVFASTVAVLGPSTTGKPLNEDAPARPANAYAKSKLLAEEAVVAEGARGLEYCILRFPLLYGPHGRGNMERMLRAIGRRTYLPIGDQSVRKSTLFFADAAAALELAGRAPGARGKTFVVAPRLAPTIAEIHAAAYRAMGRWRPPPVPRAVARLGAGAVDTGLRLFGRPARFAEQIDTLTAPAHFDGSRFAEATAFEPAVSLADGMERTAAWLRTEAGT